jgi:hypothetical protein
MLNLHVTGTDLESFRAKILSVLGLPPFDQWVDEAVLMETRQRYAKHGMVVKVVPFAPKVRKA